MDVIAREVEHGEVAVGTLCLTTVAGNDDILGIVAQADEAQAVHLDLEAKGRFARHVGHTDGRVVGIVDPIDRRFDADVGPQGVLVIIGLRKKKCLVDRSEGVARGARLHLVVDVEAMSRRGDLLATHLKTCLCLTGENHE